jgi:hypothetical protein
MNSVPLPGDDIRSGFSPSCYQIDPMQDHRWTELVQRHPKASVFHTVKWLQVLHQTYGYEPVGFTTSPPTGELNNGLLFCRINSWLTGRRLVSLPFSDHCEPLCDSSEDLNLLLRYVQSTIEQTKRLEVRPVEWDLSKIGEGIEFRPSKAYHFHKLDLHPELNEVFRSLDKDSIQRRIHRAERAGLVEKCGRSEELLKDFYELFVKTRGRHRLPPIPIAWFRNLIEVLGDATEIRVAYYRDEIPIAAILTLHFRHVTYYKYGCSDARFNKFGATPWLLWKAIAAAKSRGANEFDLGRTEEDGGGLLAFKNHWVQPKPLVYWQFPFTSSLDSAGNWKMKLAKQVFSCMPNRLLTFIGNLVYRHMG